MMHRDVSTHDAWMDHWVEIDSAGEPQEYVERRTRVIQARVPLFVCNLLFPASKASESAYSAQNKRSGIKTFILALFAIFTRDGSITYARERIDLQSDEHYIVADWEALL